MPQQFDLAAIAHVIQLAVAPVFLLTGVGALLAVFTGRLARIIDRARVLEVGLSTAAGHERVERESELKTLCRRARLINRSISLVTTCALLISGVIAALFLGVFFQVDVSTLIGLVFVAAMLVLIGGLFTFLGEVYIATQTLRIGLPTKGT
ncbi:MAG: DUF2721 domain-containing protein [Alphaproteobacteria bacterium]